MIRTFQNAPGVERPFGLPRQRRILRRFDFLRIQQRGVRTSTNAFTLAVMAVADRPGRLGLTVSKKVGKANVRNLIKRRLRHLVRENKAWIAMRDVVILVHPPAPELSFADLASSLAQAMAKLNQLLDSRSRRAPHPRARDRMRAPVEVQRGLVRPKTSP